MIENYSGDTVAQQWETIAGEWNRIGGEIITDKEWIGGKVGVRVLRSLDIDRIIYLRMIGDITGHKIKSFEDLKNVDDKNDGK